jgi:predicted DNA-binding ribbon-helix-helix protein
MNSTVKKRSIVIGGHKTSISLEDNFWACLRQIARERTATVSAFIGMLDADRDGSNLSSAIRVFVLHHCRNYVVPNPHATSSSGCMNLATTPERAEGPAIAAAAS